jgi:CRP-like cAMP-binding protein
MADNSLNPRQLRRYYPLNMLTESDLEKLATMAQVSRIEEGSVVLKSNNKTDAFQYLLEGQIELRVSFDDRRNYSADDRQCDNPLYELLAEGGSIRSRSFCQVLTIAKDDYDRLIASHQSSEFVVVHMEDEEPDLGDAMIDDDFQEDWTHSFLNSNLAANLSAATMHQLFTQLEDIDVAEGEVIIQNHSDGDYFYIVKSGIAQVCTDTDSVFKGRRFELNPGSYFGDEALIADTKRNASVVMLQSGTLGRIDKKLFEQLIKNTLIEERSGDGSEQLIDVRLLPEFRHDGDKQAINIPVGQLRNRLAELDPQKTYLVSNNGGRRSELAVYLMKQAGFKVGLQASGQ